MERLAIDVLSLRQIIDLDSCEHASWRALLYDEKIVVEVAYIEESGVGGSVARILVLVDSEDTSLEVKTQLGER